jgi:hypothetical protein
MPTLPPAALAPEATVQRKSPAVSIPGHKEGRRYAKEEPKGQEEFPEKEQKYRSGLKAHRGRNPGCVPVCFHAFRCKEAHSVQRNAKKV